MLKYTNMCQHHIIRMAPVILCTKIFQLALKKGDLQLCALLSAIIMMQLLRK